MTLIHVRVQGKVSSLTPGERYHFTRRGPALVLGQGLPDAGAQHLGDLIYLGGWRLALAVPDLLVANGQLLAMGTTPVEDRTDFGLTSDAPAPVSPSPPAPTTGPPAPPAPVPTPPPSSPYVSVPIPPPATAPPVGQVRVSLTIGRLGGDADLMIDDPSMRKRHAEASVEPDGSVLVRRVEGPVVLTTGPVLLARLRPGEAFLLGQTVLQVPLQLVADPRAWIPAAARAETGQVGGSQLDIQRVTATAYGKVLLDDVTCSVPPGKVTAIIGPSGSGKSTLLSAILGELPLSAGQILLDGANLNHAGGAAARSVVRYVPQTDDLHEGLTVGRVLQYAAGLRCARDLPDVQKATLISSVLGRLHLAGKENDGTGQLSGGERKRLSVATELVSRPHIILLDEPGSGLDPSTEESLMDDLQRMAAEGTTVVIVTHSIQALSRVDRVVALRRGGKVAYDGPVDQALLALGAPDWSRAFSMLASAAVTSAIGAPAMRRAPQTGSSLARPTTTTLLLRREFDVYLSRLRGGQAGKATSGARIFATLGGLLALPLIGAVLAAFVGPNGWLQPGKQPPDTSKVASLLTILVSLIGASLTYSSVVTDLHLIRREQRVGVRAADVIASKFSLSVLVGSVLTFILFFAYALFRPLGNEQSLMVAPPALALLAALLLTCWASSAAGLLLSVLSANLERAVALVTGLAFVQVALHGVLIPLEGPAQVLTAFIPARLGVGTQLAYLGPPPIGSQGESPPGGGDPLWHHGTATWMFEQLGLVVLTAALLIGAVVLLRRTLWLKPTARSA